MGRAATFAGRRTAAAVLVLGVLSAGPGLVTPTAVLADSASVSVAPQAVTGVAVGVTIPFDVNLDANAPVDEVRATVTFDPALIHVAGLTFDAAWQGGSVVPAKPAVAIANANKTGRLLVGALLPRGRTLSQARLVSIDFISVACGATFIGLADATVTAAYPNGSKAQVPTTVSAGAFSVCTGDPPSPTPSASDTASATPSAAAEPTPSPRPTAADPSDGPTLPPTDVVARDGRTDGPTWLAIVTSLLVVSILLLVVPRRRAHR